MGAAKGKQSDTEALCHPPPPLHVPLSFLKRTGPQTLGGSSERPPLSGPPARGAGTQPPRARHPQTYSLPLFRMDGVGVAVEPSAGGTLALRVGSIFSEVGPWDRSLAFPSRRLNGSKALRHWYHPPISDAQGPALIICGGGSFRN